MLNAWCASTRRRSFWASLNHRNIASIHGIEDTDGTLALVMEYVDGLTLADRILSGPIPVDEALLITRQIADALEYAHEHGIVHRDLKPANVKVTPDDDVKILDFGLAKAVLGEASDTDIGNSPTISQAATQTGVLLGTAAYMSPEQAKGKPADRHADIWAFGCSRGSSPGARARKPPAVSHQPSDCYQHGHGRAGVHARPVESTDRQYCAR